MHIYTYIQVCTEHVHMYTRKHAWNDSVASTSREATCTREICEAGKYKDITGAAMCSVCRTNTYEKIKLKATFLDNRCSNWLSGTFTELTYQYYADRQVYVMQSPPQGPPMYLWNTHGNSEP